jgi:hypothetical protein
VGTTGGDCVSCILGEEILLGIMSLGTLGNLALECTLGGVAGVPGGLLSWFSRCGLRGAVGMFAPGM